MSGAVTRRTDSPVLWSGLVLGAVGVAAIVVSDSSAHTSYVVARAVDYLGTALFLGGCAFVAFLWPEGTRVRATRRLLTTGWLFGLLGTVAAIGLEGAWAGQAPTAAALRWGVVEQVLGLEFGRVWAARVLLWLLAGVVLADLLRRCETAARSSAWRIGVAAVGVGLLRLIGLTGHSVDARHSTVAAIADIVHLTGISLWIGGLAVLLFAVLPRRRPEELARVVPRYSRVAMVSVVAVISAGTVLSLQLLSSVGALFHTGYGELLLTKIVLLCVILLVAQGSRSWVAHRLDFAVVVRGDAATVRPFVYSVAVESALVLGVLAAASLLVTADPGR
ncbi:MAG TPA: CopD family protein [Pseudonocardiaceae bacterium]|nr:CopD family protein [Pseudonocardiaceae bacterium]